MIFRFKELLICNTVLFAFISMNPHFRWMVGSEVYYVLFFVSTLFLFIVGQFLDRNYFVLDGYRKRVLLVLGIFISVFTLPLFHEFRIGHFIWYLTFMLIVLNKLDVLRESYKWLRNILVVISIFSLIIWFLSILSIPLPYLSYQPEFRHNPNDWYKVYGPVIGLYTGDAPRGGLGFERITGAFLEPGHFGIYLGLFLAFEKLNLSDNKNVIFLITGILTFSTAFFGILGIIIIYRIISEKKIERNIFKMICVILFVAMAGALIAPERFFYGLFGRVLDYSTNSNIIDDRVTDQFIYQYEYFISTAQVWTGFGYDIELRHVTNWRALFIRYGIFGGATMLLMMIVFISRLKINDALLIFAILLLIVLHRSYLLLPPTYFILTYLFVSKINFEGKYKYS